ncbi:CvpA family protein [Flavobacterium sp.]
MSYIDIVLGIFLIYGLVRGIKNGLFVELASLISFFIGIYIAVKFSYLVGGFIGESKTAKVAAFVLTFVFVVVGIYLLAKIFSKVASFVFLGWLNRLGGAVFAVIKTTLFLGIILSLFQKVTIENTIISKETQSNSILFNPIIKTSEVLLPVLTGWFNSLKENVANNR